MNEPTLNVTTGPNPLLDYWAPKYPSLDRQELEKRILGDPQVYERALEKYYQDNYAESRDYQTFYRQWDKKYGHPFKATEDAQFSGENAKTQGIQPLSLPDGTQTPLQRLPATAETDPQKPLYSWGGNGEAETIKSADKGQYATTQDPSGYAYADRLRDMEAVNSRRKGDYTTPGDEIALRNAENPKFLKARLKSQTPFEKAADKTPELREFDFRMGAIQDDVNNLNSAMEVVSGRLRVKYGEDIYDKLAVPGKEGDDLRIKVYSDEDYQALVRYDSAYRANLDQAKSLLKGDRFKEARKYQDFLDQQQKIADEEESKLPYWQRRPRISAKVFGKLAQSVGAVMDIGRELLTDKETYTAWDAVADTFMDAGKEMMTFNPGPSRYTRPLFTNTVTYQDAKGSAYQVDVEAGKIQAIRNSAGNIVDKKLTDQEEKDILALPAKSQTNWSAGLYQGQEILADLAIQIAGTKGVGAILGKAGIGAAAASRIGVTSSIAGQMIGPLYDQLRQQVDDPEKAAQIALTSSILIGLSSNMFGLESKLAGGPAGFLDGLIGSNVKSIHLAAAAGAKLPTHVIAGKVAADVLKAGLGEAFEETILERSLDGWVRRTFNGPSDPATVSQVASEGALAMAVGVLGGSVSVPMELRNAALSVAIDDPAAYEKTYRQLVKSGLIRVPNLPVNHPDYQTAAEGMIANEYNHIKELKTRMDAIRPHIRAGVDEADVLELIDRQRRNNVQVAKLDQAGIIGAQESLRKENSQIESALSKMVAEGVLEKPQAGQTESRKTDPYKVESILPDISKAEESTLEAKKQVDKTGTEIGKLEKKINALSPEPSVSQPAPSYTPIGEAIGQRAVYNGKRGYVRDTGEAESRFVFESDAGDQYVLGNDPETSVAEYGLNLKGKTSVPGTPVTDESGNITGIRTESGDFISDPDAGQNAAITQNKNKLVDPELDQALSGLNVDTKGKIRGALQTTPAVDKLLEQNEDALLIDEPISTDEMTDEELNDVLAWSYEALPRLSQIDEAKPQVDAITGIQTYVQQELDKRKNPPVEVPVKKGKGADLTTTTEAGSRSEDQLALAELLFETGVDKGSIDDIIDFVDAEGPDWMRQAVAPIKQKVRTLKENLARGIEGERTQAALEAQKNQLLQDIYSWSKYDETDMKRRALGDSFSQADFDNKAENVAAIYESKGMDQDAARIREMKGLPPEDAAQLDAELENAKKVTPAPVEVRRIPNTSTTEQITEEIGKLRKEKQNIDRRIKDVRVSPDEIDTEGLSENQIRRKIAEEERARKSVLNIERQRLIKRERQLRRNREAAESAVADSKQDLDDRLIAGIENGDVKIAQNGFFSFGRMVGFLSDLVPENVAQAFRKFTTKYFTERGLKPQEVHEADIRRINLINANMKKVKLLSKQLRRAVNSVWAGEDGIKRAAKIFGQVGMSLEEMIRIQPMDRPDVNQFFNELLSSPDLFVDPLMPDGSPVPDNIVEILQEMRKHIDEMSELLVLEGMADGPLAATIMNNLGIYLHRSYRIHTEGEEWVKKVQQDPSIWIPGINWLINQIDEQILELQADASSMQLRIDALKTQLASINPTTSPSTHAQISGKLDFWETRLQENTDEIQELNDRKLNAPSVLTAMLYEQADKIQGNVGVGKHGKLGAKNEGIFVMRGGKAKREAVREAAAKVRQAEFRFKQQDKFVRKLSSPGGAPGPDLTGDQVRDTESKIAAIRPQIKDRINRIKIIDADIVGKKGADRQALLDQKEVLQKEKIALINEKETLENTLPIDRQMDKLKNLSDKLDQARLELGQAFAMDIPPELRALYGEYKTPLVNYAQTIYKQTHLLNNARFLREIQTAGLGSWLFEEPTGDHVHRIAPESSSSMMPLSGFYTTKEIQEAFAEYNKAMDYPAWLRYMLAFSGKVKFGLTNLSVTTHVRNIESGGYFHLAAGDPLSAMVGLGWYIDGVAKVIPGINTIYTPVKGVASAIFNRLVSAIGGQPFLSGIAGDIANVSESFRSTADAAFRIGRDANADVGAAEIEEYAELVSLGLVDENITFGVAKSMIDGFHQSIIEPGSTAPANFLTDRSKWYGRLIGQVKQFWDNPSENLIGETYQASDTAHRVFRFKRDLYRYAKAEGISLDELGPGQNMEFKRRIADMARKTYPTYSTIPKFFQEFAKMPFIGTFISFHVEAVRKMGSNLKFGFDDMSRGLATKNHALTAIGLSRLMGTAAALTVMDTTLSLVFGALGFQDIPDDEKERDKWRHVLPKWSKNSLNIIYNQNGNEFYYTDMGPVIPNAWISQIINDLSAGQVDDARRVLSNEGVGPIDDMDIAFKALMEAAVNSKELGMERKIYNPEDDVDDKIKKSMEHIWKSVQPGVIRQLLRIRSAVKNEYGNPELTDYSQYQLKLELMATLMGIRTTPGDIGTSNFYNMMVLSSEYNQALQIYRSPARIIERHRPDMTEEERRAYLASQVEESNKLITRIIEKAMAEYNDLKDIGADVEILDENLKATRLPKATLEGIRAGKIVLPDLDTIDKEAKKDIRRGQRRRSRSR